MRGESDEGTPPGNVDILHSLKCVHVPVCAYQYVVVETAECLNYQASGFMLYTSTETRQF